MMKSVVVCGAISRSWKEVQEDFILQLPEHVILNFNFFYYFCIFLITFLGIIGMFSFGNLPILT